MLLTVYIEVWKTDIEVKCKNDFDIEKKDLNEFETN